ARGKMLVGGKPPTSGNRDIAYMLARDALSPWRTALGNAELGAEIRGVPVSERRARAIDLLEKVGLAGFENAYPKQLSQGMRQRVALARTFSLASPILLMDEPFGALDAQTKLQLEDVLLNLWQSERRTVVFITHDLSEAVSMSDRVIVMSARPARIVADVPIPLGRPRSVRALQKDHLYHELYAEIWAKLEEGLSG
ncbi:MAG: ATP-binding cassette domain-containing protein, partial [Hyphomicrobiales bacterium]|nr:ATP-binding cassette domain-containing protein [Hyphomicrobiales bacterium]